MSLLEQIITSKEQVDENVTKLEAGNSKEYKIEAIWDSAVYARESELGYYLLRLYYLVFWKGYPEEKNTWKPALVVQYFRKLIYLFHKDHFDKSIVTSEIINTVALMVRPTFKLTVTSKPTKKKQGYLANSPNKQTKKSWAAFDFYLIFDFVSRYRQSTYQSL